jgi:hypothetical protein
MLGNGKSEVKRKRYKSSQNQVILDDQKIHSKERKLNKTLKLKRKQAFSGKIILLQSTLHCILKY